MARRSVSGPTSPVASYPPNSHFDLPLASACLSHVLCVDAEATIFDNATHRLGVDLLRSNGYALAYHLALRQCLYGIDCKIHDDLL
jgi:hypothetical protein